MLNKSYSPELTSGWALDQAAQGEQPLVPDPAVAWGHINDTLENTDIRGQPVQVAGPMDAIGRSLSRALSRSTRAMKEAGQIPEKMRIDRANMLTTIRSLPSGLDAPAPTEKMIETGTINVERHHPGASAQTYAELYRQSKGDPAGMLNVVENAEDMAKLLNAVGEGMKLTEDPRTFADIKRADLVKELEPLLEGKQLGLASDTQLYGLRTLLAGVGDQTVALARMIKAGQNSQENLLKFMQHSQAFISLQAMLTQNVREVARALSQQRMVAGALDKPSLEAISNAIHQAGTDPGAIQSMAAALINRLEAGQGQAIALSQIVKKSSPTEAAYEWWLSNLLSAIGTHIINPGLSAATHVYETFALRPLAAAFGSARAGLGIGNTADRIHFSEAGEAVIGSVVGARDGMLSAFKILMDPKEQGLFAGATSAQAGSSVAELGGRHASKFGMSEEAGMQAGHLATAGLRLIRMEDEVTKSIAYRSEIGSLAMRSGLNQGLEGAALDKHIQNFLDAPPHSAHEQALDYADKISFQGQPVGGIIGAVAQAMLRATDQAPILKYVAPLIRTPANVVNYAWENSATSALNKKFYEDMAAGGARADMAFARFTGGAAMTYLAYVLYSNGIITGGGPRDHEQRKVLEATGWKPHAVKLPDGTMVTWNRAEPFALAMTGVVDALDAARFAKEELDIVNFITDASLGTAHMLAESSFIESAFDFVKIFFGGQQAPTLMAKWTGNFLAGFNPYSSLEAAHARASEKEKRTTARISKMGLGGQGAASDMAEQVWQAYAVRTPGQRDKLRPMRYWDGSVVVPEAGYFARLVLPVEISKMKKDDLTMALVENGISSTEPNPLILFKDVQINLLDLDSGKGKIYDEYIKSIGEARREAVARTVEDSSYNAAEPGARSARAKMLEGAMSKGYAAGVDKFFDEILPRIVDTKDPSLSRLAEQLGTDPTGLINDIREGFIKPTADRRFDAKGAPGKRTIEPNIRF